MTDSDPEAGGKAAWTAVTLLLVASLCGAVILAEWPLRGVQLEEEEDSPSTVEPVENGTVLWPYTARTTDAEGRTLAINVVVVGDTGATRRSMTDRSELEWNESAPEDDPLAGNGSDRPEGSDPNGENASGPREQLEDGIAWGDARGAARYTRVIVDGDVRWLDESYQLHSGTYFGQRLHVRAYEDPDGEWTAMQAHTEHWDWFRLRHTVTGVSEAQREVERDFMDAPFVDDVARRFYDNPTADGDGWATVVRLSLTMLPLFGITVVARLQETARLLERLFVSHAREASIGALLFGTYLGVRLSGIGLELLVSGLSPKLIAAPLYLVLVAGLPAIAYRLGRGSNPVWAGAHAVGGLGTAFLADFALMDVSVVPLQFGLHRLAVILAIGMVAAGSAVAEAEPRGPLAVGTVGWLLALALPFFGYV